MSCCFNVREIIIYCFTYSVDSFGSCENISVNCPFRWFLPTFLPFNKIWILVINANKSNDLMKETEILSVQCKLKFVQCFQIIHLRYWIRYSSSKRISIKISVSKKKNRRECLDQPWTQETVNGQKSGNSQLNHFWWKLVRNIAAEIVIARVAVLRKTRKIQLSCITIMISAGNRWVNSQFGYWFQAW